MRKVMNKYLCLKNKLFWYEKQSLNKKVDEEMIKPVKERTVSILGPVSKRRKYSEITTVLRRSKSLPNLPSVSLQQLFSKQIEQKDNYNKNQDAEDCKLQHRHFLCRANSHAQVQYILIRDAIKENNRLDLINLLTRKHEDINKLGADGLSAIHIAAEHGTHQIMEILLSKGASINMCNDNGDYPLDLAVKAGNFEIAQFLIQKGARQDNVINGTPPTKPKRDQIKRRSNTISIS